MWKDVFINFDPAHSSKLTIVAYSQNGLEGISYFSSHDYDNPWKHRKYMIIIYKTIIHMRYLLFGRNLTSFWLASGDQLHNGGPAVLCISHQRLG